MKEALLYILSWLVVVVFVAILLGACSMQTELTIRCRGNCDIEFERGVDTRAPTPSPDLLVPKLRLTSQLSSG